jgi:hypothetical protein
MFLKGTAPKKRNKYKNYILKIVYGNFSNINYIIIKYNFYIKIPQH